MIFRQYFIKLYTLVIKRTNTITLTTMSPFPCCTSKILNVPVFRRARLLHACILNNSVGQGWQAADNFLHHAVLSFLQVHFLAIIRNACLHHVSRSSLSIPDWVVFLLTIFTIQSQREKKHSHERPPQTQTHQHTTQPRNPQSSSSYGEF